MRLAIQSTTARMALAAGVVAGGWLMPMESGGGTFLPSDPVTGAAGLSRIYLAQADAGQAERPVSYTLDQADRGEKRYASDCEECHGDDLKGGLNGGPPLSGLAFEEKYADGLPASLLFSFMSAEMPPNSPGRYPANTYADLMAYVLKKNGYQPGAPLPSDPDALNYVIIEK